VLHSRRKRQEELARAEAAGQVFWTDTFDERARVRLWHAFTDCSSHYLSDTSTAARSLICRDEGLLYLVASHHPHVEDFGRYLMEGPNEMVPSCIEAMLQALLAQARNDYSFTNRANLYRQLVPIILREHRISFEFVEDRMVEFSSQEMHQSVVAPALRLLSGRAGHDSTERAYRDSLDEISRGKPSDAITDAGTALQSVLTELGCTGNSLGPLIKSAKAKGLLAAHDGPMLDAIDRLMNWVSADRSSTGDAHLVTDPSIDDAWLIVHMVGALILRLVGPSRRGEENA
jgi:hypothetical protein